MKNCRIFIMNKFKKVFKTNKTKDFVQKNSISIIATKPQRHKEINEQNYKRFINYKKP